MNSQNLGPYGDAITYELIPHIEKTFRGIGQPAGRGSCTAARPAAGRRWRAQVFYPDEYNGCWAACPDPIDFRAYTVVDIYKDKNAYYLDGPAASGRRGPAMRNYLGHVERDARGA